MRTKVYIAASMLAMAFSAFASEMTDDIKPTVRQDRIWLYYNFEGPAAIDSVKFIRLETIGNTEYHVYNGIGNLPYLREEAFMREENGKIYRYMTDSIDVDHGPGEYLLYDLGVPVGESFNALMFRYDVSEKTVKPHIADIVVEGKGFQGLDIPDSYHPQGGGVTSNLRGMRVIIEGSYDWGNCIFEEAGPAYRFSGTWTAPMIPEEGEYSQPRCYHFGGICDSEGNLLCIGDHAVGVDEIEDEKPGDDTRMYDLNGREISNPEPGTIYIQGGRKRVSSF